MFLDVAIIRAYLPGPGSCTGQNPRLGMIRPTETDSGHPLMHRLRLRLEDLFVDVLLAISAALAWALGLVDHPP